MQIFRVQLSESNWIWNRDSQAADVEFFRKFISDILSVNMAKNVRMTHWDFDSDAESDDGHTTHWINIQFMGKCQENLQYQFFWQNDKLNRLEKNFSFHLRLQSTFSSSMHSERHGVIFLAHRTVCNQQHYRVATIERPNCGYRISRFSCENFTDSTTWKKHFGYLNGIETN